VPLWGLSLLPASVLAPLAPLPRGEVLARRLQLALQPGLGLPPAWPTPLPGSERGQGPELASAAG